MKGLGEMIKISRHFWRLGCLSVVLALGCTSARVPRTWPEPWLRDAFPEPGAAPGQKESRASSPSAEDQRENILTQSRAFSLALRRNPELAAAYREVQAHVGKVLQSGLLPNPKLEMELEEFGGSGGLRGFDGASAAVQVKQLLELGRKRAKRMSAAELEHQLAAWDYEAARLDVLAATRQAFMRTLGAQRRLELAGDLAELAEKARRAVSERVAAGKVPALEATTARVAALTSRIAAEQTERELEAARKRLAATWGERDAAFTSVTGQFEAIHEAPPLEDLLPRLKRNPDLARWDAEIALRKARIALAEAAAVPDVTVKAGVQGIRESEEEEDGSSHTESDHAFILGFSLPLPLFDRNQGGIMEAHSAYAKAVEKRRGAETERHARLNETYAALASAYQAAVNLHGEVLPAAQQAFEAAREGYGLGKFQYLALLDAQRTLFEAREQYIDSLAAYHDARTEVGRLTGEMPEYDAHAPLAPKEERHECAKIS